MHYSQAPQKKIFIYVFLPVLLALIYSAIVNLQLFQDGGSYLLEILVSNAPAIRNNRISVVPIQLPTLFLMKVSSRFLGGVDENLALIRFGFCLSYAIVPVIALILSWFIVRRKREDLFVWAAVIILFVNLVNFSGVSELLISFQFACPLMLAALTSPKTKFFRMLCVILLPFLFFLHPLVAVLFAAMALGNFYVGFKQPQMRVANWGFSIILATAAILKLIHNVYNLSNYESSFLASKGFNSYVIDTSIENKLFLIVSVLISIACLLNKYQIKMISSRIAIVYLGCMIVALIAGFLLVVQYSYREFPLKTGLSTVASLCIIIMMAVDSLAKTTTVESNQRHRLVRVLAIIFMLVITSKSFIWNSSIQKLRQTISSNEGKCLELNTENFKWLKLNPYKIINTWALPSLSLIEQDYRPRKVLLDGGSCQLFFDSSIVKFDDWSIMPKKYVVPTIE